MNELCAPTLADYRHYRFSQFNPLKAHLWVEINCLLVTEKRVLEKNEQHFGE